MSSTAVSSFCTATQRSRSGLCFPDGLPHFQVHLQVSIWIRKHHDHDYKEQTTKKRLAKLPQCLSWPWAEKMDTTTITITITTTTTGKKTGGGNCSNVPGLRTPFFELGLAYLIQLNRFGEFFLCLWCGGFSLFKATQVQAMFWDLGHKQKAEFHINLLHLYLSSFELICILVTKYFPDIMCRKWKIPSRELPSKAPWSPPKLAYEVGSNLLNKLKKREAKSLFFHEALPKFQKLLHQFLLKLTMFVISSMLHLNEAADENIQSPENGWESNRSNPTRARDWGTHKYQHYYHVSTGKCPKFWPPCLPRHPASLKFLQEFPNCEALKRW